MFLQIVITKVGPDLFKVNFFDATTCVYSEKMTAMQVTETIFTSLQNLKETDALPPSPSL